MQTYINKIGDHVGQTVTIKGWLHNRRSSGKIHFLVVRDGTGFLQVVMGKKDVDEATFQTADHLGQESAIIITGTVKAEERATGGYEMVASGLEVVNEAHDYPITPKEHGVDYLMDRRHLWIRAERQTARRGHRRGVARARSVGWAADRSRRWRPLRPVSRPGDRRRSGRRRQRGG